MVQCNGVSHIKKKMLNIMNYKVKQTFMKQWILSVF